MLDRRIKFRHIQAFVEIVRQRSLKGAAEKLLLTQPAISRTLAELEEIAGVPLMARGRGGVSLTPPGEVLLSYARMSLAALEQGFRGLDRAGLGAPRQLRIGALPSVAARLMPEVAARLSAMDADLQLTIADGAHDQLIEALKAASLDVVIGRLGPPETMKGLSFTQLYLEEVAMVVRPGHPLLATPDLRLIVDWPVIYPPPQAAIRPMVERLLIAEGVAEPGRRIETVSGAFARVHVLRSDAVWIISAGVVAGDVAEGRLARWPVPTTGTEGPVGLMARTDDAPRRERQLLDLAIAGALETLALG
ncbi:pca operon transcription factor PcaQ [Paracoccus sp. TK19116]|uniref:Pca operon transcription factor PcaQ n=1 Tax=Paracoccus albicereus TaxID=2922394 RepID=A0ABT1MTI7_9RHOB|nr:pca operon transcription factor PcaQ [Paracoccus albicereus]MCQ0971635.1 pca operon transcription factor PcaQ [Paracoccus albicereus]